MLTYEHNIGYSYVNTFTMSLSSNGSHGNMLTISKRSDTSPFPIADGQRV